MAITEDARHRLYQRLEEVLGNEEATTLMEQLGHVSWTDLATKRDLDQLAAATKHDFDQLAAATKHDFDQLAAATKHDLDQHAAATKHDLDQHAIAAKRDLDQALEVQSSRLRYEFERGLRLQTLALFAANSTVAALVLAAAKLV